MNLLSELFEVVTTAIDATVITLVLIFSIILFISKRRSNDG